MAFAMNRHLLEREWIVPRLQEFKDAASQLDIDKDLVGYSTILFGPLALQINSGKPGGFLHQELPRRASVWFAIFDLYESRFASLNQWIGRQQKLEASTIQAAYNELKAKSDSRITSQEGKLPARARNHFYYSIVLSSKDNSWTKNTRLNEYFKRQKKVAVSLLGDIEQDVKRQKDILESLVM
jgi:hypothetical protein